MTVDRINAAQVRLIANYLARGTTPIRPTQPRAFSPASLERRRRRDHLRTLRTRRKCHSC
jgi:hypothetical protein